MNNLTDPEIVEELYKASQAGAEIDLIVRAVCALRPGRRGPEREHPRALVLGRFLEHSRLFCFEAGETQSYLLGSADLMPRNLDHRIEVVVPVEDAARPQRDRDDLQGGCSPTTRRRGCSAATATWERVQPKKSERRRPAQLVAMRGRDRARRRAGAGA